MYPSTAIFILKHLSTNELLEIHSTLFVLRPFPRPIHEHDVREAFLAAAREAKIPETELSVTKRGTYWSIWVPYQLFDKLYKIMYTDENVLPAKFEGSPGPKRVNLPALFTTREKTQTRQIPLAVERPWPFIHLMELGGMIIVKTDDPESMIKELRQFLNNHPRYDVRVDARVLDDNSISIFTYWFKDLPPSERKNRVNINTLSIELQGPRK